MNKVYKYLLIYALMLVSTVLGPVVGAIGMAAGMGILVGDIANGIRRLTGRGDSRQKEPKERSVSPRREQRRALREGRRAVRREMFDPKLGWDFSRLPGSMKADLSQALRSVAHFDAAGIEGLVKADGRKGLFSFEIDPAREPERYMAVRGSALAAGALRRRSNPRRYVVESPDPSVVAELAKIAWPPQESSVVRESVVTSQYLVSGVSSYEEALEKFRQEGQRMLPVNTFSETRTSVDGLDRLFPCGAPLTAASAGVLPTDTFIVNVTERERHEGKVEVPYGRCHDAGDRWETASDLFVCREENRVELAPEQAQSLSDGLPEGVRRGVRMDDGEMLAIRRAGEASKEDLVVRLSFDSQDAMMACLQAGEVADGTLLVVDRADASPKGPWEVTVPVDGSVLPKLALQGDASAAVGARAAAAGVDREDMVFSMVVNEVGRVGYASVKLSGGDLSLGGASIGGVPVDEFAGRLASRSCREMDSQLAARWLVDAVKIQSVNLTVDAKKAEVCVSATMGNGTYVEERRRVSEEEIHKFAQRGEISKGEIKELLMQLKPELFRSYLPDGKPSLSDPVGTFMKGVSVREAAGKARKKEKTAREELSTAAATKKKRTAKVKQSLVS